MNVSFSKGGVTSMSVLIREACFYECFSKGGVTSMSVSFSKGGVAYFAYDLKQFDSVY